MKNHWHSILTMTLCAICACTISVTAQTANNRFPQKAESDNADAQSLDIESEKPYTSPLSEYAGKAGKFVGTCVSLYDYKINVDDEGSDRTKLLKEQFNMVVCENEMKFDSTEPSKGNFNYYHGDRLVSFAQKHGMRVRGHALVWHSQVPQWLSSDGKKNDRNFTAAELQSIMKNHIQNVVKHWKGKVAEWDVCNEVLDEDQSIVKTDPTAFKLRQASVWNFAGEDYIEKAFRWAHEADPDAVLILNDFGVEFKGGNKAEAFYNLAKSLKEKGVPIDGVGLQCHFSVGKVKTDRLRGTMERFKELGLKCVITELDLGMDDNETNRRQQAQDFHDIAKIAMEADNCNELMVWGLTDDMSWRNGKNPLLYYGNLTPKDAYYGMHAGLREATEETNSISSEDNITPPHATGSAFYNMQGQRMANANGKGLYIIHERMSDGRLTSRKVLAR